MSLESASLFWLAVSPCPAAIRRPKNFTQGEDRFAWAGGGELLKQPFVLFWWLVTFRGCLCAIVYFNWTGSFPPPRTPRKREASASLKRIIPVLIIGHVAEILHVRYWRDPSELG